MFSALHVLLYSTDPDADRDFLRDVLELPFVEDHPGWLIFKAPPAEVAVHPTDGPPFAELHLMCDDIEATTAALTAKGVPVAEVREERWGRATSLTLPSGATIGVYQPKHRTAYDLQP
jgi:catechol 2,3-dioxygenase-like lactoylglutathione lyase family enzyme